MTRKLAPMELALLELLAGCPDGATAATLEQKAIGASVLRRLVARSFARVTAKRVTDIRRTVARFHITATGKAALNGSGRSLNLIKVKNPDAPAATTLIEG